MTGAVISTKMLVIRQDHLHYIPKYGRQEKRHRNISARVRPRSYE